MEHVWVWISKSIRIQLFTIVTTKKTVWIVNFSGFLVKYKMVIEIEWRYPNMFSSFWIPSNWPLRCAEKFELITWRVDLHRKKLCKALIRFDFIQKMVKSVSLKFWNFTVVVDLYKINNNTLTAMNFTCARISLRYIFANLLATQLKYNFNSPDKALDLLRISWRGDWNSAFASH